MGLTCYRAMVFSDMPLGMHETFLRLREDHPMIRKVSGLVVLGHDECWGYGGGESRGQGRLADGIGGVQTVVDQLTSRSMRLEHPEYTLDDDTHCLLVTTTDSEKSSVGRLLQLIEQTMPKRSRCDWLHIEWGPGLGYSEAEEIISDWNGGDFDRNCIRNRTASEKVEYGHHEWSAAIIQYLESRMLERETAIVLDKEHKPRSFGFATLDFSQMEGRRFLEAKAFLDVVERENERVDLDKVYQHCSEALKGGKGTYKQAKAEAGGSPDKDKYAPSQGSLETYQKFDVKEQLSAFRRDIMLDGGTIEKVERRVEELISELKKQVDGTLDGASRTAQERLCVIRALLGEVSEYTQGKPLRPTLMLDDCESACLEDLATVSQEGHEEAPTVQALHTQRRLCEELMDDIVNMERGIEIDKEAGEDTAMDMADLHKKKEDRARWVAGYRDLRNRYTRHRRQMFTGLSSLWMDQLFERLVNEATHPYTPPVQEEKPLLSRKEKKILIFSVVIIFIWLWIAWQIGIGFWFEQGLPVAIYGLAWVGLVSYRLRKPKVVDPNPWPEQRKKWHEAAQELYEATLTFATVNRFQKQFDEVIRKPLIIEYNRLTEMLTALRTDAARAQEVVGSAFTKVDFVQHIGDADSFNLYYERELDTHMKGAPSIAQVYLQFKSSERRDWTPQEAVEQYRGLIQEKVSEQLGALSQFKLLAFLLGERKELPLFVKPNLGSLSELIRKADINLEVLHDFGKGRGELYVFQGDKDDSHLSDQFREQIKSLFEDSASSNLHFVRTDDPNRIGFLRMCLLDEQAMAKREQQGQKEHRRKRENPAPVKQEEPNPQAEIKPQPRPTPPPRMDGTYGRLENGRFFFSCRGKEVSLAMPALTEEDQRTILSQERFEHGVKYKAGEDPRQVIYDTMLNYDAYDGQLKAMVHEAESLAVECGVSVAEVLVHFVQALPYEAGGYEVQYPIETLMRCNGDCDEMALLLKKFLGFCGVGSALLRYDFGTDVGHVALGIEVSPNSAGLTYGDKYVFVECTAPSVVGVAGELANGKNPADYAADLYCEDQHLGPWVDYPAYRGAAMRGFPPRAASEAVTLRNISDRKEEGGDDQELRNKWKIQS